MCGWYGSRAPNDESICSLYTRNSYIFSAFPVCHERHTALTHCTPVSANAKGARCSSIVTFRYACVIAHSRWKYWKNGRISHHRTTFIPRNNFILGYFFNLTTTPRSFQFSVFSSLPYPSLLLFVRHYHKFVTPVPFHSSPLESDAFVFS